MALKKNDKIIAIAGVLILIIAAVSIVVLYDSQENVEEIKQVTTAFDVKWIKGSGVVPATELGKLFADKKADYTKSLPISAPAGSVLTKVEFKFDWTDDKTYGLLRNILNKPKKGLDTVTAKITMGDETQSYPSTGKGNKTFSFDVGKTPQDESVDAVDISEVEQIVKDNSTDKNEASFKVTVNCKIGESKLRLLKYFMDKGNGFNLKVTYEYVTPQITDQSSGAPPETPPEEPSTPYLAMLITTGSGVRW
jgi:hypothetical protein